MIEYSWEILSLYTKPSENGLNNIVKRVTWTYSAKENAYFASSYFDTNFETADANNFISYSNLTPEVVFQWISSIVDINEVKNQVTQKLMSTKTPESVEKKLPWDQSINYTGDEEYVLVNNESVVYGPTKWSSSSFNEELDKLGSPEDLPVDILAYKQGIIPVDQPLVISDSIKIYKCGHSTPLIGDNQYVDYLDFSWEFLNGLAVKKYTIKNNPVKTFEEVKNEKIEKVKNIFSLRESVSSITVDVQSGKGKFNTSPMTLFYYMRKNIYMDESDVVTFNDVDGNAVTLNKNDFGNVIHMADLHIESLKNWGKNKIHELNQATTIDEINSVNVEDCP